MAFSHSPKIATDGLVLCLDAADKNSYPGSGTTWTDLSGNGHNATLSNASMGTTTANVMTCNSYDADVATSTDWAFSGDFTIESWIKPTGYGDWNGVVVVTTTGGAWFGKLSNGTFGLRSYGVENIISSTLPTLDVWSQVLITRNTNTMTLYVNGSSVSQVTDSRSFSQSGLVIGNDGGAEYFSGEISNVKIYGTTGLSASEVLQNYNATKSRFGL